MKPKELRMLTKKELEKKREDLKQELFNIKFRRFSEQKRNVAKIRNLKRDIARINTLLRELELGINIEKYEVKKEEADE